MSANRFGAELRRWRTARRMSQLDLALAADVSARHVSFLETGRSRPTAAMVLRLAEHLDVPGRECNALLLHAGFAPAHPRRPLEHADMAPVRAAIDTVLTGYLPYPALVVDRGWHLVAANAAVARLTRGVAPALLEPPANVLRLSLHPDGLAPVIRNLAQWRAHVLGRLAREVALTADNDLAALHRELSELPGGSATGGVDETDDGPAVPLRLHLDGRDLAFLSTVTTFGTAVDVTLAELSIEAFLPADATTADALHQR